jgi:hypothetical protein
MPVCAVFSLPQHWPASCVISPQDPHFHTVLL